MNAQSLNRLPVSVLNGPVAPLSRELVNDSVLGGRVRVGDPHDPGARSHSGWPGLSSTIRHGRERLSNQVQQWTLSSRADHPDAAQQLARQKFARWTAQLDIADRSGNAGLRRAIRKELATFGGPWPHGEGDQLAGLVARACDDPKFLRANNVERWESFVNSVMKSGADSSCVGALLKGFGRAIAGSASDIALFKLGYALAGHRATTSQQAHFHRLTQSAMEGLGAGYGSAPWVSSEQATQAAWQVAGGFLRLNISHPTYPSTEPVAPLDDDEDMDPPQEMDPPDAEMPDAEMQAYEPVPVDLLDPVPPEGGADAQEIDGAEPLPVGDNVGVDPPELQGAPEDAEQRDYTLQEFMAVAFLKGCNEVAVQMGKSEAVIPRPGDRARMQSRASGPVPAELNLGPASYPPFLNPALQPQQPAELHHHPRDGNDQ